VLHIGSYVRFSLKLVRLAENDPLAAETCDSFRYRVECERFSVDRVYVGQM
jgi:hypothetical protein